MKFVLPPLIVLLATGCATYSANMQIGSQASLTSLSDQRDAQKTVKVTEKIPAGAKSLGKVDASRCHRDTRESAPTVEMVTTDIKVAAYARGADGIAGLKVEKHSGLTNNCWYILDATAEAFALPEKDG